ncbi:MAG TPA: ribonuclease P protein component [Candidatus Saccharimonadales bacterium]|nr:ribonuclease P protein component [Candidatus Saccharimonadales bacterium]
MISARHRFHGYGSLRRVYREGRVARGQFFAIKTLDNPRRKSYRLAVVVSRKVSKSAVARNRIRRRLYEVVRRFEPIILGPQDLVITVFNEQLLEESHQALESQVKKQLKQLGVLAPVKKS